MYEDITYEKLLQRMLDKVKTNVDKREGSVIWDTHSPTAIELQLLYIELDNLIRESYGDTASREFLILRAKERGLSPEKATNAILRGEFTPTDVDVIGKRFNLGEFNYIVTEKDEYGTYKVMCETAGATGDNIMGDLIPIEYISGLETAKLLETLIPGEDEEDTETFRTRYLNSFNDKAFGGNKEDYISKTNSLDGVGATKVSRVWNSDIKPADMIPNETVTSWYNSIVDSLEEPVKTWLQTVFKAASEKKLTVGGTVLITIIDSDYNKATDELIELVQEKLDPVNFSGEGYGTAPIGHVVTVRTADEVEINIVTNIQFDSNHSWDNLGTEITSTIKSYLAELRTQWGESDNLYVRISQIESRLLDIKGIIDIGDTTINGESENKILSELEIPVLGGVSLNGQTS